MNADLFGADYVYFLETILDEATTREDGDVIAGMLDLPPGAAILDVGCGEGRLTREMSRRGYRCAGVDKSEWMIGEAKRRSSGLPIGYRVVDLAETCVDGEFDGAISWFTSFGFFDDETNFAILVNVLKSLVEGGVFVIDVINRDFFLATLSNDMVIRRGDDWFRQKFRVDERSGRFVLDRDVCRNGQISSCSMTLASYIESDLAELLLAAGFRAVADACDSKHVGRRVRLRAVK